MMPIDQKTREEVEIIAMDRAMEFERAEGRVPENVSKLNLGWDITSCGNGEERYIEVKGHKGKAVTSMSPREMQAAMDHKDKYFLYVLFHAKKRKKICVKRNPADTTSPEKHIEYRIKPAALEC